MEVVRKVSGYQNSKSCNENIANIESGLRTDHEAGHADHPVSELHDHNFVEIFLPFSLFGFVW